MSPFTLYYQEFRPSQAKYKFLSKEEFHFLLPKDCGRHDFSDKNGRVWLKIRGFEGIISAEYAWDGATPKWSVFNRWFGTPDFASTIVPTIIHDALLQFHSLACFPLARREIDAIFDSYMGDFSLRWLYYGAVRAYTATIYPFEKHDKSNIFCSHSPRKANKLH